MSVDSEKMPLKARPVKLAKVPPEEEIVISGFSGRFPESNNTDELFENLINKRDMITDDKRRWKLEHPDIPRRMGKLHNIEKFDARFFGVHYKQAHIMDPSCRILLECAYEAVIDAGVNPKTLHNTRTGVFIGASFSESEKTWMYDQLQVSGFSIIGCARTMLANRISYWLGVTGPSYSVDTACSSSLTAMEHAYRAIRGGECDAAIVGGANLCLHPIVAMQFFKLGVLSPDGRSKTFDESANGYVRSEAISAVFLQKSKDAKRVYATYVHAKANCDGYKEQGITFPSSHVQSVLLDEFYLECGVPTLDVSYVEAHGTGTRVGDPEEIKAIDKVLGRGRTRDNKLLVGSVKTNLGHSEPASGLVSVAKVLLAMENGVIPAHLNFTQHREEVKTIFEERIKVTSDTTPWNGGYAGVNSFGFGGANVHILLKSNPKEKVNNGAPQDDLPRLVVASGRSHEAVDYILKDVESRPVDVEFIKLLHDIHTNNINGHISRGYTILPPGQSNGKIEAPIREIQETAGTKRPVWFVFAGMGSQWPGMGEALLRIPIFAAAIKKCDATMKPYGMDVVKIITNREKTAFDNIMHSFIGIASIQIGLVDILRSVGIEPDNIIGHSVGELGCAYADGCCTAEEMMLSAYARGLASIETTFIHGAMAAVGLGYKDIVNLCPPDIEVACHNSADSSTISGPTKSMKAFIAELQAKDIFVKEVPCSNIPYHSSYIASAGPKLLQRLKKVLPNPKLRSSKWLSTSVPIDKWNTPEASYSSAEYHANNQLSPVLFEEVSAFIPKDAITIEIAPHGLLQAILRRSLPPSVVNIALTQRGHKDNVLVLLQALGKMYNVGLQPRLASLYPPVEYPVSRSTRMISPLIKWEHSDDWFVTSFDTTEETASGERKVKISLKSAEYEFLDGHLIDGRNLFPATGYLYLVWETLSMMHGLFYTEMSIIFENVKFVRATNLLPDKDVEFTIMIHRGTGNFEVVEGGAAVVTGQVRTTKNPEAEKVQTHTPVDNNEEAMSMKDVYKELRLRGYQYHGIFRSILNAKNDGSIGHIVWLNNWIAFMDNMLQFKILSMDTRSLYVPTFIKKMIIDGPAQIGQLEFGTMSKDFPVYYNKLHDAIVCGGVQIRGLDATVISRKKPAGDPVLEEYKFVPFTDRAEATIREIARMSTHIAFENQQGVRIRTVEIIDETDEVPLDKLLSPWLSEALGDLPLVQADLSIVSASLKTTDESLPSNVQLVDPKKLAGDGTALLAVGHRLLSSDRSKNLAQLLGEVRQDGFLISREDVDDANDIHQAAQSKGFHVILEKQSGSELFVLLKKQVKQRGRALIIKVNNDEFDWVVKMRETMSAELEKESATDTQIIFVGQGDFDNGLMGLINCLRQEPGGEIVRGILIQDPKAPEFSVRHPLYAKQLQKDLAVSVLRENSIWGSYRHLPLPPLEVEPVEHTLLRQTVRGDLNSLKWLEGPIRLNDESSNLVRICYSSINFKDVMLSTAKLTLDGHSRQYQECPALGFEFSGIDMSGKRIMGLHSDCCIANMVASDKYLSWEVPDDWSLEEAASVPCVYGTCLFALYVKGGMKKDDKILIHAGTGGVGQAAINLALYEGCEIFTTVGTPEKRQFIREHFPQIPDDHIGNSRDTSFEQMIMEKTNGRGVDIVLNSLAEEKLLASVACLAWGGRFLEIGKFDLSMNNPLGMKCFLREVSFQGVMLDHVIDGPDEDKVPLKSIMNERLKRGAIKPLVRTVFPKERVEDAFRYMAGGKHVGKVIIKVRDEKDIDAVTLATPRYYCLPDRSYVILGGLGGFGLELVDWLVLRGAKHVVITSRMGIRNGYQKQRIQLWKSYGVNVLVIAGKEASNRNDCQAILEAAEKIAPVDGVFNLAVVLKDALWDNQTPENFEESFRSKAWATKNLDILTRKLCTKLRHFVVFSSVSCGRGNAGQTNYGMSNSVMERICERRANEGLPGLAVQWGAVGDVGLVADMQEDNKELVIGGTLQQRITSCLQELDGFLKQKRPIVSSMVVAEKKAGGAGAQNLVDAVLNIMGLKDLKGISSNISLSELGMDSMMSVEIKQTLEREFEIFLTAQDIRTLSFAKLQEMSDAEKLKSEIEKDEDSKPMTNGVAHQNGVAHHQKGEDDILLSMRLVVNAVSRHEQNIDPCLRLMTREEPGRIQSFLIPGIESVGIAFRSLVHKLKSPTSCLQLGFSNHRYRSIFEMADYFLPYVMKNCNDKRFSITGYSFGSLIAIELVRRLEAKGFSGQLVLIDGAPEPFKAFHIEELEDESETEIEKMAARKFVDSIFPSIYPQFIAGLEKCTTWESKVELLNKLCSREVLDVDDSVKANLITSYYIKVSAMIRYDASKLKPITTPVTLLKPTKPILRFDAEDYGLSKITTGAIRIHYISGNHVTIMSNDDVVSAINGEAIHDKKSV